ncbi:hypothetical protein CUMW_092410 [Citrus unshiu]|nr:hypothetical protein CUMW_092410 [Citrus unshiu]
MTFLRGCFGCCNKPTLVTAVDEPSKGLRIQGRTVKKPSILEDFWSSSTCEMDNNVVQSRSLSSISISNQPLDPSTGTSGANNPQEFTRQQWLANKKPQNRPQVREPSISWNASYESLLGTNKPFPQRVPLATIVLSSSY